MKIDPTCHNYQINLDSVCNTFHIIITAFMIGGAGEERKKCGQIVDYNFT